MRSVIILDNSQQRMNFHKASWSSEICLNSENFVKIRLTQ